MTFTYDHNVPAYVPSPQAASRQPEALGEDSVAIAAMGTPT
jgi:hypothetical protein